MSGHKLEPAGKLTSPSLCLAVFLLNEEAVVTIEVQWKQRVFLSTSKVPGSVPSPGRRQEPDDVAPAVTGYRLRGGRPFPGGQDNEVAAPRSNTEVGQELAKLTEQLVDIVRSLQSQTQLPESGPDNKLNILGTADHSLASPKLVASNASEKKMRDILHDLEDIRGKLQENFLGKQRLEEQRQGKILEGPSSSSRPLTEGGRLASWLVQRSISPTFDLRSLSCSLEVSKDCRKVTVSHFPQPYSWSRDRFTTCQVFCSQAFSSGQHYWEVDTQHCSHWAVGVASWKMSRDQTLGRTRDSSCLEWKGTSQLSVWHMVKETVLGSEKPKVVGIYLDLDQGKLAFYSVADQEKLLWERPVSASSPLHPAFWLYGLHPGNSLTIRPVRA
ncbi:E3 ubiquitin-protein ligase RNF135 isoform X2 [Artibeus jamaicensis]|uniref:E3 ubiquitin-protein ligase RNF135 isoform X2 n=1 Tax=Artibeus jamaicensis TaxID=9417 RepID=UPI00235ABAD0|nr:E3 ubiquitin-protein ligase RNF135 isoform X2 [Artibeus jamaicensis]